MPPIDALATILIVDDDPANLLALEAILEPLGQRVVRASTGPEALSYLVHHDCAIILLDVQLPGMNGFETATVLKQRPRTSHIPIIFLSGVSRERTDVLRSFTTGAVDYIVKPYDPDLLRSKVAAFVELDRQNKELKQREAEILTRERELSEAAFRSIFESTPLGLLIVDDEGRLLEANAAFLRMLGYTLSELRDRHTTWRDLTPPEWMTASDAALGELEAFGSIRPFEKEYFRKNGTRIAVLIGGSRLRGQPPRHLTFALDISERKQIERERDMYIQREQAAHAEVEAQRAHLYSLFMQAAMPICITRGPRHVFELVNEPYRQLAGRADLIGRPAAEVIPALQQRQTRERLDEVYATGAPASGSEIPAIELWGDHPALRLRFFNILYQPLYGSAEHVEGVMTFAFEVTEQVRARQAIEALAEDLQKAVRIREAFLTVASHELRTPVTALLLRLQGLQRNVTAVPHAFSPSRLQTALQTAVRQVRRLIQIVDTLLDVTRIESGSPDLLLSEVDLVAIVKRVVENYTPEAASAACALELTAPAVLTGHWDDARLEQVVGQLLSNAIRFGPGKPVHVTIESTGTEARLVVQDHGIGIEPEKLGRIFDRFERAASERNYGGLGLGLFVTREIVRAMGGTISVVSTLGEGSTFTVMLPIAGPPANRETPDDAAALHVAPGSQASANRPAHPP